jgi:hypothetical protein
MKIFNFKNPRHIEILKEELHRMKNFLSEGTIGQYSMDEIWKEMTSEERETVLLASSDDDGPDLADQYSDENVWDNIPADLQDQLNIFDYQLAKYDLGARSMIRGIENAMKQHPEAKTFVDKFVQKIGRSSLQNITVKQSYQLNPAIWNYIASKKPGSVYTGSQYNDDTEAKRAWMDAQRRAGRTSGLD